jgi:hypothetical protein
MPPNNYPWHETAKARFAALKIRYISSMSNGCKHGISGETSDSELLSMSGSRAFSSLLLPAPSAVMRLLF